jgi:hypothetical protein
MIWHQSMISERNMILIVLAQHPILSRSDGHGVTTTYYYYDAYAWIVGALALAWLAWYLISRYMQARALRRRPRGINYRLLKRVVKAKSEFSSTNLQPGFSNNIHAVGVGMLAGSNEYCIQVFVNDANDEMWVGSGAAALPNRHRGVPLVLIEMPVAGFLSDPGVGLSVASEQYPNAIREHQEVIIGGISGAHTNLAGQSGTIGYFCTRKSKFSRRKEVHLLSNSHVFADLRKAKVDDGDLIMQPSPGEPSSNRPIGALVNFSALKFAGELNDPNHVDAAIAKLWGPQQHKPVIPMIGAVKGHVAKKDIEIGEAVRKFGRTTGYTEGCIFSIYLDIWIRYDRTGQSAFFQNQFLIEPALPKFSKFVSQGDSGSLVVDAEQHAIGLIFAGMSEAPKPPQALPSIESVLGFNPDTDVPKRIESYGVANPISEVLDRLKIELLV